MSAIEAVRLKLHEQHYLYWHQLFFGEFGRDDDSASMDTTPLTKMDRIRAVLLANNTVYMDFVDGPTDPRRKMSLRNDAGKDEELAVLEPAEVAEFNTIRREYPGATVIDKTAGVQVGPQAY